MKKIIASFLLIGILFALGYWFLAQLGAQSNHANIKDEGVVHQEKNLLSHLQHTQEETPTASVMVLTPQELSTVKTKANQIQGELSGLTVELNKNLDNVVERKKIEDKYKLLTQEYNQLVLQIVKAEIHSGEVAVQ